MNEYTIKPIAHIRTDLPQKFGLPRQAGIVEDLEGLVVFEPEYRDREALRGIEEFSHLWLIWGFSQNLGHDWAPTVRPPRLGGNERVGVFASRSPFRPNPLGLSCLRLLGVEERPGLGLCLRVGGVDMMDMSPIFDIKPYIPYSDIKPQATEGFTRRADDPLEVAYAPGLEGALPPEKVRALTGILSQDPRPRYQDDPQRSYALDFAGKRVCFQVEGKVLTVTSIEDSK